MPSPMVRVSRLRLLFLVLASLLLGGTLGWRGSATLYEEIQVRQLTRLLQEELATQLNARRYSALPALMDRFHRSRQVRGLAWCSPAGRRREERGDLPEKLLPPPHPEIIAGPEGNLHSWSPLPTAPGETTPDWLYLELQSLAPPLAWYWVPGLLVLLGIFWVRRPLVSSPTGCAEEEKQEAPICSEPSSEDCSSPTS
jgi:hypothetical protein